MGTASPADTNVEVLKAADTALLDWLRCYAADQCDTMDVMISLDRIKEKGGTLAYIAHTRELIKEALGVRADPWYVYILKCADGTLYTGITNDLEARLKKHNSGKGAKYTRGRTPVEIVHSQQWSDKSRALKAEFSLKKKTRAQKLALIADKAVWA